MSDDALRARASTTLALRKDDVLRRWEERVRRDVPEASREPHAILVDTLPEFVDNLAEALSPAHPRSNASEGTTIPREHGGERVRLTRFRLADVIREYHLLRDVLLEVLTESAALNEDVRGVVLGSLDAAVSEACSEYLLGWEALRERIMMTLAHDIRTPLGAAKASLALILRRPEDSGVARWAARADASLDRVDRMIRTLLDVSRAGSGARIELDPEHCDLRELVRDIIGAMALPGDRVVLDATEPVFGWWGRDALGRAIENLLANAVKYGASGTAVTVRLVRRDERATLSVHNEGSYIAPERQAHLFDLYRRGSNGDTASGRGWGVGLALVRAVADAHGGAVTVDSLPETGTTFTLDLPLDVRRIRDGEVAQ